MKKTFDLLILKLMMATKKHAIKHSWKYVFLSPEINLFSSECFLSPKYNWVSFWKSATIQCARWVGKNTCFFSNARSSKTDKKHSGLIQSQILHKNVPD